MKFMDILRASESTGARILNTDNLKSCTTIKVIIGGKYYSSSTPTDASHQGGSVKKKGKKKETTLVDYLFYAVARWVLHVSLSPKSHAQRFLLFLVRKQRNMFLPWPPPSICPNSYLIQIPLCHQGYSSKTLSWLYYFHCHYSIYLCTN